MAPYLSLAAMENAELLALHTQPIIDSVISGNYALAKVLPQIYSVNPDPIKSHIMTLVIAKFLKMFRSKNSLRNKICSGVHPRQL